MFALFFSLYYSMFAGTWKLFQIAEIRLVTVDSINKIGEVLTSLFNNVANPVTNLGDVLMAQVSSNTIAVTAYLCVVAFVLALITSIGIVVMAVKGIKRVFFIFFMPIR